MPNLFIQYDTSEEYKFLFEGPKFFPKLINNSILDNLVIETYYRLKQ